jgi:protein gp37
LTVHPDTLDEPFRWPGRQLVFVNSMSDLFHDDLPLDYVRRVFEVMAATPQHTYQILTKRGARLERVSPELDWPPNVWMGVSVEDQRYAYRTRQLATVPAAARFVSAEPLLGELTLDLDGIDWVIVGGESGREARPMNPAWVRSLRDQCRSASVPFFFKQWGGVRAKAGGRELDGRTWDEMPPTRRLIDAASG